jgi:hypothetical protein
MARSIRWIAMALLAISSSAWAQSGLYLATNVTISKIAPVSNDATAFSVTVTPAGPGGGGFCTPSGNGGAGITFYLSSMPNGDAASLQRLWQAALAAFSNHLPVNIASYTSSTDCTSAAFIEIEQPI